MINWFSVIANLVWLLGLALLLSILSMGYAKAQSLGIPTKQLIAKRPYWAGVEIGVNLFILGMLALATSWVERAVWFALLLGGLAILYANRDNKGNRPIA